MKRRNRWERFLSAYKEHGLQLYHAVSGLLGLSSGFAVELYEELNQDKAAYPCPGYQWPGKRWTPVTAFIVLAPIGSMVQGRFLKIRTTLSPPRILLIVLVTVLLAIPLFFLCYALVISTDDMIACAYDVYSRDDGAENEGLRKIPKFFSCTRA